MKECRSILFILLIIFFIINCIYLIPAKLYAESTTTDIVLYICPSGNDINTGSKDNPFKTLEGSQTAITKLIKENKITEGKITVFLRKGNYQTNKTFTLDKDIFIDNKISITYKGYKKEKVIINGSVELPSNKFKRVTDKTILSSFINKDASENILEFDLKEDNLYFGNLEEDITKAPELFFNDAPMTLSKWPNNGFLNIDKVILNSQKDEKKSFSFQIYNYHPQIWSNSTDIWMFGYWSHDWYDSTVKVNSINLPNSTIESESNPYYGITNNQRFYFFNILQELDIPGEYYVDRKNGILYFYPPANIDNAKIQFSQFNDTFIKINDSSNVTFENLIFEGSRGSGITVSNSNNIKIDNCIFRNLSQNAVTIDGGDNCGVENSTIYNTGTGGITLNGGDRYTLTSSRHYSYNNQIYDYARIKRTYSAAINISGVGNKVSNNLIHDGPHTAILFSGNDNIIEYNEIYNVATETDDVGAIYTGRDWTYRGNIIKYNFFHNIGNPTGDYGKGGIYLDDCMSNAIIYGNIFYKVDTPLFIGGGRDITIKNNIIVDCRKSICFDERGLTSNLNELYDRLSKVPYPNDVWQKKYPQLMEMVQEGNPGVPKGNVIENNVLYKTTKNSIANSVVQYGVDKNNIIFNENPGFTNIDKMDFSLKNDSTIFKTIKDFNDIPFKKIGLIK